MLEQPDYITCCVAGLEVHLFGAEENEGAPIVFFTHGRGGAIENAFDQCRDLRSDGFLVIGVSQRNHGRRIVDPRCNAGWGPSVPADMFGVIHGTAIDISTLIDMLPARLGIRVDRIGMSGISLGGHTTLMAMAHDDRIQVGASIIGSGDYLRLMQLRAEVNETGVDDFDRFFPPALREAVAKFDPISNPARFADRPLLMTNGGIDNLVQPECNQRFYNAIRPYYKDADTLRLSIYPELGHMMNPAMWGEVRQWLRRWLLDQQH